MSMIFQKRSTRTRVSAETGLTKLGGHPLFLGKLSTAVDLGTVDSHSSPSAGADDIQLGKNETLRDTANVLGRYNDIILARVFEHDTIVELCKHSSVPVINGLSDTHHPLQLLADAQTIREAFGTTEGLTIAWVGDGNNILHTFLSSAGPLGYNVRYACPAGYQPDASIVDRSTAAAKAAGVSIFGTHIPEEAVRGADVIVTDTWVSMGQETEAQKRLKDFAGYQVTHELAKRGGAKPGWKFLHCLPRKPQEVDDAVFYSDRSLVWQEAENRMWTFMAVALAQVQGGVDI